MNNSTKLKNVIEYLNYISETIQFGEKFEIGKINGHAIDELTYAIKSTEFVGKIEQIDSEGGEGLGEYFHYVFRINHPNYGDVMLKVSGTYDSWNGVEWDYGDVSLCEEREVLITRYVNVADEDDVELSYEPKNEYLDLSSDSTRDLIILALKSGILNIKFEKTDNSIREMNCTLNSAIIPSDGSNSYKIHNSPKTACAVWDMEENGWRSFRWNYVKSIEAHIKMDV
jgi:hypothetical protein